VLVGGGSADAFGEGAFAGAGGAEEDDGFHGVTLSVKQSRSMRAFGARGKPKSRLGK
jgi:hypothetical protein